MTDDASQALADKAGDFATELESLLRRVLPGEHVVRAARHADRYRVSPRAADGSPVRVKLTSQSGSHVAGLEINVDCILDSWQRYLAVEKSEYKLFSEGDNDPLLRYDYRRDMHTDPVAHWQVHAERGAFGVLQARTGHASGGLIKKLHLPVGGSRMRPCLEDLLQLLIQDCGVRANSEWEEALAEGRERWRRRQVGASVRDAPDVASETLRQMGYEVAEPAEPRSVKTLQLRRW